jgi:hypothetical protein
MTHSSRWCTCFTSGTVNFANNSSGSSTLGACGCRCGIGNETFRGGHGEVGVRKPCKGDNCGVTLEGGWCNAADEDGKVETVTVDGRRAI